MNSLRSTIIWTNCCWTCRRWLRCSHNRKQRIVQNVKLNVNKPWHTNKRSINRSTNCDSVPSIHYRVRPSLSFYLFARLLCVSMYLFVCIRCVYCMLIQHVIEWLFRPIRWLLLCCNMALFCVFFFTCNSLLSYAYATKKNNCTECWWLICCSFWLVVETMSEAEKKYNADLIRKTGALLNIQ